MNSQAVLRQYSKSIYTSSSVDTGIEVLSDTAAQLGFEGAVCCFWPGSMKSHTEVPCPAFYRSGSNMSSAIVWQRNFVKSGMFKADFVYRACRTTTLPVVWSYDNCPEIVLGLGHRASMAEIIGIDKMVKATGFLGGISIPIHGLGGFFGYVTFISKQHLQHLLEQQDEYSDNLLGIVHRFYDALSDKFVASNLKGQNLTVRELECLTLLGLGKTLNETAEILGLSYSTIRFHLYNSQRKLGTNSRAHAIAKAASMGLLGRID